MDDKADPGRVQASADRQVRLATDQCVELALTLLRRTDMAERGITILRQIFPDAPEEPLNTGAFHLYRELPLALMQLLAEIELSLRDPARLVDHGAVWHVVYHLYNWMQLAALLPWARRDIADEVQEAIKALEGADAEFALRTLQKLARQLEGAVLPPSVGDV